MHEKNDDDQARVGPSVPCVAPAGSTAEQCTGAVTAAERPDHAQHRRDVVRLYRFYRWHQAKLLKEYASASPRGTLP